MTAKTTTEDAKLDRLGLLAAAVTIVLWASAFAGIRVALEDYSPYSLALLRYLIASVVLGVYMAVRRTPLPQLRDLPGIIGLGFFGFAVYNVALNAGELGVTAGAASFLIATAPVFIALLAAATLGERLTLWGWLGIALSFSGVALISLGDAGTELVGDGETQSRTLFNVWALLVLVSAVATAIYSVGQKSYLRKYGALRFTTYAIWAGTALMLVFTPGLISDVQNAAPGPTWAIVYMGVLPGAVGYVCWSYVLARLPASVAGTYLYFIPALATLIAWLWLGEVPGWAAFAGGALVIAGVVLVNRLGRIRAT